jgi:hypothetical protein
MFSRLVRNSTRMTGALATGLYLSNELSTPSLCAGSSNLSTSERLSNLDVQLSAFEKKLESSKPAQKKPVGPIIVDPLEEPLKDVVWEVPGSKSITNRALILAALRPGTTTLTGEWISAMRWLLEPIIPTQRKQNAHLRFVGVLHSDDTRHMRNALTAMGIEIEETVCDN